MVSDIHDAESDFSEEICYRFCQCDLDNDESCDGIDYTIFFRDWGRNDCNEFDSEPCECDLNNDGSCNGHDLIIFVEDWGRENCGECS
jgi:hypothetical protein